MEPRLRLRKYQLNVQQNLRGKLYNFKNPRDLLTKLANLVCLMTESHVYPLTLLKMIQ